MNSFTKLSRARSQQLTRLSHKERGLGLSSLLVQWGKTFSLLRVHASPHGFVHTKIRKPERVVLPRSSKWVWRTAQDIVHHTHSEGEIYHLVACANERRQHRQSLKSPDASMQIVDGRASASFPRSELKTPSRTRKADREKEKGMVGGEKEINLKGITMTNQQMMYGRLLKVKIPNKWGWYKINLLVKFRCPARSTWDSSRLNRKRMSGKQYQRCTNVHHC